MKLNNDSGITLIILVLTIILMLILGAVTIKSFKTPMFNQIVNIKEDADVVRSEQDREAQNAINSLGGLDY